MTNKSPAMQYLNPVDEARADKIEKILKMNSAKISRLVQKQMTETLTEFDVQTKKNLHGINSCLVAELKAMPVKGKIGVVG